MYLYISPTKHSMITILLTFNGKMRRSKAKQRTENLVLCSITEDHSSAFPIRICGDEEMGYEGREVGRPLVVPVSVTTSRLRCKNVIDKGMGDENLCLNNKK